MGATYVDQAAFTAQVNGATSTTCPGLADVQAGDLCVAIVAAFAHNITAPAGWTEIGYATNGLVGTACFAWTATGPLAQTTWTADGALRWHGCHILAYRGVTVTPVSVSYLSPPGTATNQSTLPGLAYRTGNELGTLLVAMTVYDGSGNSKAAASVSPDTPESVVSTTALRTTGSTTDTFVVGIGEVDLNQYNARYLQSWSFTGLSTTAQLTYQSLAIELVTERPPNAPTLSSPPSSTTIDRTATNRFAWAFSDPDSGDSQSAFDLRYSSDGGTTWTTVSQTTPNTYWDAVGGTFAAGSLQWQVRTYDQARQVSPWSASLFFTASTPAAGPTILDPINGGTVAASTYAVSWSFGSQQAYELRRVADNAGAADTSTVLWTTGQVTDAATRSVVAPFPTNNEYEHVQLRCESGNLWTAWTDVRVDVFYTPPPTPTAAITTDATSGTISLAITNPASVSPAPATAYNDIYVTRGLDSEYRAATNVPINTTWIDYTPASGVDNVYRIVAVGTNAAEAAVLVGATTGSRYGTAVYGTGRYS